MLAKKTLPESFPKSKARFTLRCGSISLETFDNANDAWKRHDALLAAGIDLTLEVVPAVL
jgi:hypothetical protein